jgi:hypothetical protein
MCSPHQTLSLNEGVSIWGLHIESSCHMQCSAYLGDMQKTVVLENNNEHLTQRSAAGLPLVRQEVALGFYRWVDPGEPESAAVQSVRPSAG